MKHRLLDDELFEHIDSLPRADQADWVFLTPHEEFPGRWEVEGMSSAFFVDFEEEIGRFRTVSPASLKVFLDRAEEMGYYVAFTDPPEDMLKEFESLNEKPDFSLNSDMPGVIAGMLPFQLQGFNFLKGTDKGGIAVWSTGTGKTALETALTKHHLAEGYDLVLMVVKSNNKVDTQRKIKMLGDVESTIIDGTPAQRNQVYWAIDQGDVQVAITNYEKFRQDSDIWESLLVDRDVVIFWDEMPVKLSNRTTKLYDAVRSSLYEGKAAVKWEKKKPSRLRQYALSATPIENTPVGVLNQVRLIDPEVFPTISQWEKEFVASRSYFTNEPETFHNLDKLGLRIAHITHQVDKEDPDIAAMFPDVFESVEYLDWSDYDRKLYDKLQDIAADLMDGSRASLSALQLINVLQMVCGAPTMVAKSAENREKFEAELEAEILGLDLEEDEEVASNTGSEAAMMLLAELKEPITNEHHTKIEKLRELICDRHPDEKIVIFSRYAAYIQPILIDCLDKWGVSHVVYRGTDKQRLEAKDSFRNDPDIRVFLSSDAGSDSIDLPEASVAIDYDEPMKFSTKIQRRNRIHRINSTFKSVTFYTLRMANSVEDRIAEIIATKKGYHDGVFGGDISENSASARMTTEDLKYILFGN